MKESRKSTKKKRTNIDKERNPPFNLNTELPLESAVFAVGVTREQYG